MGSSSTDLETFISLSDLEDEVSEPSRLYPLLVPAAVFLSPTLLYTTLPLLHVLLFLLSYASDFSSI